MRHWNFLFLILLPILAIACRAEVEEKLEHIPSAEIEPDERKEKTTSQSVSLEQDLTLSTESLKNEQPVGKVKLTAIEPLDIYDDLFIAGSSSIHPLVQALYNRFIEEGFSGVIEIESITSGVGFRLFCEGTTDIASASRRMEERFRQECQKRGLNPIPFRIGTSAVVIIVNAQNNFVNNISLEELAEIFTAEKWSDVNPNWPDEDIIRFIPIAESGIVDFFGARILAEDFESLIEATNTTENEDQNLVARSVAVEPYGVAFVSYAYYKANSRELNLVPIQGITANLETVNSERYPLTRPLFLYSDAKIMQEKPQVAAFINFFLSNVNEEIPKVGYFPATVEALDEAELNWLEATEN
ncbi:MAG: substrate-binding domain-containing protein [Cyanobacteria bacterium SBLK]|nr:substrate-binding domain-containing protein [Cyanobacteria bacterium SBLK]